MATVRSSAPRHIIFIGVALAAFIAGCSMREEGEGKPDVTSRPAPAETTPATARTPSPEPRPASSPRGTSASAERDPAGTDPDPAGFHLDDPDVEYEVPRRPSRSRKGRPIEVVLRSSPAGAVAAVDGVTIGPTPSLWEGLADGSAREFTFVLPGYAIARYRFVPTQSGTVHATLEPIKTDAEEAAATDNRAPKPQPESQPGAK